MKHRIFGKKLGRNHNERQALFRSQTRSMFTYGNITTTEAKAKAVLSLVESLANTITQKSDLLARRELFRHLQDQTQVNLIVTHFKEVFGDQKSNFTKMTRIKRRQGDDALIVNLSFVKPIDFKPVVKTEEKREVKKETKKVVKKVVAKKVKTTKKE